MSASIRQDIRLEGQWRRERQQDFVAPAELTSETSLSSLELDTLRSQKLADGKDFCSPNYKLSRIEDVYLWMRRSLPRLHVHYDISTNNITARTNQLPHPRQQHPHTRHVQDDRHARHQGSSRAYGNVGIDPRELNARANTASAIIGST